MRFRRRGWHVTVILNFHSNKNTKQIFHCLCGNWNAITIDLSLSSMLSTQFLPSVWAEGHRIHILTPTAAAAEREGEEGEEGERWVGKLASYLDLTAFFGSRGLGLSRWENTSFVVMGDKMMGSTAIRNGRVWVDLQHPLTYGNLIPRLMSYTAMGAWEWDEPTGCRTLGTLEVQGTQPVHDDYFLTVNDKRSPHKTNDSCQ